MRGGISTGVLGKSEFNKGPRLVSLLTYGIRPCTPSPAMARSPAVELLGAEGIEDIQCVPCQEGQNPQDDQDRSLLLYKVKEP